MIRKKGLNLERERKRKEETKRKKRKKSLIPFISVMTERKKYLSHSNNTVMHLILSDDVSAFYE
jgi:hypothetical protein